MKSSEKDNRFRFKKGTAIHAVFRRAKKAPGVLVSTSDFPEYQASAIALAFHRLTQKNLLRRASKGFYYYPKQTLLGPSQPSGLSIDLETISDKARPTRGTAAYLLGLTTQMPARPDYLVVGRSIPTHVRAARLHKRKDMPWFPLTTAEGAWLEVVWDRGKYSELSDDELTRAMLAHLQKFCDSSKEPGKLILTRSLRRMLAAAKVGPPRSRAVIGAMLQDLGLPATTWKPLKESLNPHSRFDFGPFSTLPNANDWQCR